MAEELRQFFREKRLHPLVAWNRYIDLENNRKVTLDEFEAGMDMLGYEYGVERVFLKIDSAGTGFITLNQIDHFSSDLWNSFKAWCSRAFADTNDMVASLSSDQSLSHLKALTSGRPSQKEAALPPQKAYDHLGRPVEASEQRPQRRKGTLGTFFFQVLGFDKKQFAENSVRLGWHNASESVLFKALDVNSSGTVTVDDIPWFDREKERQERKDASKSKGTQAMLIVMRARVQALRSLQGFLAYLRKQHGCVFKAWRQLLDKNAGMSLTRREFFAAVRQMSWTGDLPSLWHALDPDENGYTTVEDFAVNEARHLALFKFWMQSNWGDAKTMMRALNTVNGSHTKLSKSGRLTKEMWFEACTKRRCPIDFSKVFDLLDFEGKGSVMLKNLKFLDRWNITSEWLLQTPSEEAARAVRDHLTYRFKTPVKAWIKIMDRTHAGKVTWPDFKAGLEQVNFKGDIPGAWLAFDADGDGYISLKEFDQQAATTLATFRCWADDEFGGVVLALEQLDEDLSGTVSYREFRTGVKAHGYRDDVQYLFNCLDVEGKGQLQPADVFFLDEWELSEILDVHHLEDFDTDEEMSEEEEKSSSEKSEEEEQKDAGGAPDETKKRRKVPLRSRRSLLPWPRIKRDEPPAPRGMRSRLLGGCGTEVPDGTTKRVLPMHHKILAALKARKANELQKRQAPCSSPETGRCSSASDDAPWSLLRTIGWNDSRCITPDPELHAVATSPSPEATRCKSPYDAVRCRSPQQQQSIRASSKPEQSIRASISRCKSPRQQQDSQAWPGKTNHIARAAWEA